MKDLWQNGNIAVLPEVASETESDEEDGSFTLTKAQLANADHATDFDLSNLSQAESGIQWWVGDWLNYGERQYGETYTAAKALGRWSEPTLMNYKWVASKFGTPFGISRRREILSWSHHQEATTYKELSDEEQDTFLDRAAEEGWSKSKLREEIRKYLLVEKRDPSAFPDGTFAVVYADPPWQYDNSGFDEAAEQQGVKPQLSGRCNQPRARAALGSARGVKPQASSKVVVPTRRFVRRVFFRRCEASSILKGDCNRNLYRERYEFIKKV